MANEIRKEVFVCTDIGNNNNKTWRITEYDNASVLKEWGRIDDHGAYAQNKLFGPFSSQYQATKEYDDSVAQKLKGKKKSDGTYESVYTRAKTVASTGGTVTAASREKSTLAEIATRDIVTDNPETMKLVKLLTERNIHNIVEATAGKITYNSNAGGFSTPLGVVTPDGIAEARLTLDTLVSLQTAMDSADAMKAANDYLRIVPQDWGRGRIKPYDLFGTSNLISKQVDILDALEVSFSTMSTVKQEDGGEPIVHPPMFDAKLSLVTDTAEIDRISKKYYATLKGYHAASKLKPKRVFAVQIGPMHNAFMKNGVTIGNIMELWHGTKTANLLSILKSGLKISPPSTASIAGKMFGNGIYFSDQSTKSLNYAYGYWGGSGYENTCFMFLVNVAMGTPYMAKTTNSWHEAPKGYHSCFCEGGKCAGLMNNEMIVYKEHQANPVFLIEFAER